MGGHPARVEAGEGLMVEMRQWLVGHGYDALDVAFMSEVEIEQAIDREFPGGILSWRDLDSPHPREF